MSVPQSQQLAEACFECAPEAFSPDDCAELTEMPFPEALGHAHTIWCEQGREPEELDGLLARAGITEAREVL